MLFFVVALALGPVTVLGSALSSSPTARIDSAIVRGVQVDNIEKFLGIPFSKAERFRLPVSVPCYEGTIDAMQYGPSCPQQASTTAAAATSTSAVATSTSAATVTSSATAISVATSTTEPRSLGRLAELEKRDTVATSEDCLSVNVYRPPSVRASENLPVVVWIYGGGFEIGTTRQYDGQNTRIVNKSIAAGSPIIVVSINYRVSALGFLASKEVKKEGLGNFGLYDQRAGLEWVHKYISAFGGDPRKVTIWGESAGAVSVTFQMLAFGSKTDGLFRGAFMQSGAALRVGDITHGQSDYDSLVAATGCSGSKDTLDCLRKVPLDTLQTAMNNSPIFTSFKSLALTWTPRVDGTFLQDEPYELVKSGNVPAIPFVSGSMDDEGTFFSTAQSNLSTEADFRNYVKTNYLADASDAELEPLWTFYPSTPSLGSPFDTGDANVVYPQYKRLAAFQGDFIFQGARRLLLESLSGKQKMWSYLSKQLKTRSTLGSFHTSDLMVNLTDVYVISFTNNLDPNTGTGPVWPAYTKDSPKLYTFFDGVGPNVTDDTYRSDAMKFANQLAFAHPQ